MSNQIDLFPNPGLNYMIKERLGAGAWKEAFRAYNPSHGKDMALVYFKDKKEKKEAIREGSKLLALSGEDHKYSGYIAEFHGVIRGQDDRLFFVEELIDQPLDRLGVVQIFSTLTGYARDLCRGLEFLHSNDLVHRDLKLDNCGISFQGRIKIFDLGSVTSENGEVKGTILTRAPELFGSPNVEGVRKSGSNSLKATKAADVWALGATIFALRTGTYPFVLKNEIVERRRIGEQLKEDLLKLNSEADRDVAREKAQSLKDRIDEQVKNRILENNAESELIANIIKNFKGSSQDILKSMLSFNPASRMSAEEYAERWDSIWNSSEKLSSEITLSPAGKLDQILHYANRVFMKEVNITYRQRHRLLEEIDREAKTAYDRTRIKEITRLLS